MYHSMIKFDAICPGGEIGRHKGLKIPRRKLRAGSSPALEVLKSRKFFKSLDEKYDLLPDLMALDYLDSKKNILVYDERKYNAERNEWSLDSEGKSFEPSIQRSHKAF